MLNVVPEPAATVIATAAFTGARRGEIRGMYWENYREEEIFIGRSVWQKHITPPKSTKSKAPIPIISRLAQRLEFHRLRLGNPETGPMFPNASGGPMDLNSLLRRSILPVFKRCAVCGIGEREHESDTHDFERDKSLPAWRGGHGFRRGLATNLHRLGVPEKTIQAILRHANVSTTQTCYIKTAHEDARAAMNKLESVLDSNQPVKTAIPEASTPNLPVTIH